MNRNQCRSYMIEKLKNVKMPRDYTRFNTLIKRIIEDTILISKQDTVPLSQFEAWKNKYYNFKDSIKELRKERNEYKMCLDILKREL